MDPSILANGTQPFFARSISHPEPLEPRVFPSPLPPMPYNHPLAPLLFTNEPHNMTLVQSILAQAQQLTEHQIHTMNLTMVASPMPAADLPQHEPPAHMESIQSLGAGAGASAPLHLDPSELLQGDHIDAKPDGKTRRGAKDMEANLGVWTLSLQPGPSASKSKAPKHGSHGSGGKPMNAFLLFCAEHRPTLRRRDPFVNNNDTSRALGVMWRQLTEQEKELYHRRSQQLRAEHWVDSGLSFFSPTSQTKQHSSSAPGQRSMMKSRQQTSGKVKSDEKARSKEHYDEQSHLLVNQQLHDQQQPQGTSKIQSPPSSSSRTSLSSTSASPNTQAHLDHPSLLTKTQSIAGTE